MTQYFNEDFQGMNNRQDPDKIPTNSLLLGHNVEVDKLGTVRKRSGISSFGNNGLYCLGETDEVEPQYALRFDGASRYVKLPDGLLRSGNFDFTIEAWVYAFSYHEGAIINFGTESLRQLCLLWLRSTGKIALANFGDDVFSTSTYPLREWFHVRATYDATTRERKIFLNGVEEAISSGNPVAGASLNITNDNFLIGSRSSLVSPFDGYIAQVRLFVSFLLDTGAGVQLADYPRDFGPIFYSYPLSEGVGQAARDIGDIDPTDQEGLLVGFQPTLDFDGTNDYIDLPNNSALDFTSSFTVEALVDTDTVTGTHRIIGKVGSGTPGWSFGIFGNKLRMTFHAVADYDTIYTISTGTLYHLACVYDSSNTEIKFYVDGELVETINSVLTPNTTTAGPAIGRPGDFDGEYWNGTISEVRVWNDVRTEQEINDYKYRGVYDSDGNLDPSADTTNLVGYWRLNEGSGTTANDLSASGNDGSLTNFSGTYWQTTLDEFWNKDIVMPEVVSFLNVSNTDFPVPTSYFVTQSFKMPEAGILRSISLRGCNIFFANITWSVSMFEDDGSGLPDFTKKLGATIDTLLSPTFDDVVIEGFDLELEKDTTYHFQIKKRDDISISSFVGYVDSDGYSDGNAIQYTDTGTPVATVKDGDLYFSVCYNPINDPVSEDGNTQALIDVELQQGERSLYAVRNKILYKYVTDWERVVTGSGNDFIEDDRIAATNFNGKVYFSSHEDALSYITPQTSGEALTAVSQGLKGKLLTTAQNTLFIGNIADKEWFDRVYYSEFDPNANLPTDIFWNSKGGESGIANSTRFITMNGKEVKALYGFGAIDKAVIFTDNEAYQFDVANADSIFGLQKLFDIGCAGDRAVTEVNGMLVWMDRFGSIWSWRGVELPQKVSWAVEDDAKGEAIINRIDKRTNNISKVSAGSFGNKFYFSVGDLEYLNRQFKNVVIKGFVSQDRKKALMTIDTYPYRPDVFDVSVIDTIETLVFGNAENQIVTKLDQDSYRDLDQPIFSSVVTPFYTFGSALITNSFQSLWVKYRPSLVEGNELTVSYSTDTNLKYKEVPSKKVDMYDENAKDIQDALDVVPLPAEARGRTISFELQQNDIDKDFQISGLGFDVDPEDTDQTP